MSHKRFLSIYDEYADDLLSYGYGLGFAKEDIEDTLQDVILNLYRNDPQLKDVRNVKVYLFTALKNRLMNTTRRQRMDSLDDGTGQFDVSVTVSDLVEDEEERRQLSQGNGGKTNPGLLEWLMGYEQQFTRLIPTPTATDYKGGCTKRFWGGTDTTCV